MKLDIAISATHMDVEQVDGKVVCVIDVFRATSVMITALGNGAQKIIPVMEVEDAFAYRNEYGGKYEILLGGERGTRLISGFDKDNSPQAYIRSEVEGKTIVFTTTNGTRAIKNSEGAMHIYIGALINAAAVSRKLIRHGEDITLVCSGREGSYTMEDALCAGLIADHVTSLTQCSLTDIAWTLRDQYRRYRQELLYPLEHAQHYNFIRGRGLHEDIAYCLQVDISEHVPHVNLYGEIVL